MKSVTARISLQEDLKGAAQAQLEVSTQTHGRPCWPYSTTKLGLRKDPRVLGLVAATLALLGLTPQFVTLTGGWLGGKWGFASDTSDPRPQARARSSQNLSSSHRIFSKTRAVVVLEGP